MLKEELNTPKSRYKAFNALGMRLKTENSSDTMKSFIPFKMQ